MEYEGKTVMPIFVIRNGYFEVSTTNVRLHIHKTLAHTFRSKIDIEKRCTLPETPPLDSLSIFSHTKTQTYTQLKQLKLVFDSLTKSRVRQKMNLFRKKTSPKGTIISL